MQPGGAVEACLYVVPFKSYLLNNLFNKTDLKSLAMQLINKS